MIIAIMITLAISVIIFGVLGIVEVKRMNTKYFKSYTIHIILHIFLYLILQILLMILLFSQQYAYS